MKNKSLILFMGIGFVVTILIWGFVGGCGTTNVPIGLRPEPKTEIAEDQSAEGIILEKSTLPVEKKEYVVQQGDTLWSISKKFGISVADLKETNSLKTDSISAGQKLVIQMVKGYKTPVETEVPVSPVRKGEVSEKAGQQAPVPKKAETKPGLTVHKVRKGDSIWRISQIYGTTPERIANLNGISKNAELKPGQEILVPSNGNE